LNFLGAVGRILKVVKTFYTVKMEQTTVKIKEDCIFTRTKK